MRCALCPPCVLAPQLFSNEESPNAALRRTALSLPAHGFPLREACDRRLERARPALKPQVLIELDRSTGRHALPKKPRLVSLVCPFGLIVHCTKSP